MILVFVIASGFTKAMPEFALVWVRSPLESNSTTPNCAFPAFGIVVVSTFRVVPAILSPVPSVMSFTVPEAVPFSVEFAPGLILRFVIASGFTRAIPELLLVSNKSPVVASNSTTPNCAFPAFGIVVVSTLRVGPAPELREIPAPTIISSTFDNELVPFSVLAVPGLILAFVIASGFTEAIPEFALVWVRSPLESNSTTPNWASPAFGIVVVSTFRVVSVMFSPIPSVISFTAPEAVPLSVEFVPGAIFAFVIAKLATKGAVAVPARSPASWSLP